MATQAKVSSTEALERFRAALIVFLTKSRRSLDDATDEVRRMRQWVQHDQVSHWEGEYRRRKKQLEQAQQELMSARLSKEQSAIMARQMALNKAQNAITEAEFKLRKLKGWSQNFESAADPIVKRMERLRQVLNDLPKAIAYLVAIQKTLEAYAQSGLPPELSVGTSAASSEAGDVLETPLPQIEPPEPILPKGEPNEPPPSETTVPESASPAQK
jgi:chromosome segregation ATPase